MMAPVCVPHAFPTVPTLTQVTTSGTRADGAVDAFAGSSVDTLAWLAGVHSGGNLTFAATAGTTYYIRLEGEDNSTGPVQVLVECPQCAAAQKVGHLCVCAFKLRQCCHRAALLT